jgi:predicted ATPase with chaperone activity
MAVVPTRLCRAPHRTVSDVRLISGGRVPMPDGVSPAHQNVLFLRTEEHTGSGWP